MDNVNEMRFISSALSGENVTNSCCITARFKMVKVVLETTWGYIVKRLSAYGGCLGSQRR